MNFHSILASDLEGGHFYPIARQRMDLIKLSTDGFAVWAAQSVALANAHLLTPELTPAGRLSIQAGVGLVAALSGLMKLTGLGVDKLLSLMEELPDNAALLTIFVGSEVTTAHLLQIHMQYANGWNYIRVPVGNRILPIGVETIDNPLFWNREDDGFRQVYLNFLTNILAYCPTQKALDFKQPA